MISILEFDPVITVFPYALLYYALLLVSSGLALLAVSRSTNSNKASLQIALVIIFVSQIALLAFNLLAYQGFQPIKALFPLGHRVLNLVCLVWLIWALFRSLDKTFPNWLPIALTVALLLVGMIFAQWWLPISSSQDFNQTWMDYALIGSTLILILVSAIIYYSRYHSRIVEAWLILTIAAVGFILYLLLPSAGNLPATVMLSQMIYYPLLISLAYQYTRETLSVTGLSQSIMEQNSQLRANIANAFLGISLKPSQDELEKALTHSLSLYLMADMLGLVQYDQGSKQASLRNTYDLIREDHIEKIELSTDRLPTLFEKFRQGENVLSNRESELISEKNYLMQTSGYNQIGNLLLYPLDGAHSQPRWALLGLSPYTNKLWGLDDIQRLDRLRGNLTKVLDKAVRLEQDAHQIDNLQAELLQKEAEVSRLSTIYTESQTELQGLSNDLQQTQSAWTEEVNLWIGRQKELEAEVDSLQQTIEENQEIIAETDTLRHQKIQLEETISRNTEQTIQLKNTIDHASLLLQKLTSQDETDEAKESKG